MNEPAPLPDDLLEYLDAARETEVPSAAMRDRMLLRLGPLLPPIGGGGSSGGDVGGGPATDGASTSGGSLQGASATTTSGLLQGKLAVAIVSGMIGAGGGAAVHATFAPPRTVVSAPATTAIPRIEIRPVVMAAPTVSAEVPAPSASASSSLPADAPLVRKSSMRAERILLEAANAAIIRGDYATAIASLQLHKQRYPRGELAQERDILLSQATKRNSLKGSGPP
jgi:hypothetical protein